MSERFGIGHWPALNGRPEQWYVAGSWADEPWRSDPRPLTEEDVRYLVGAAGRSAVLEESLRNVLKMHPFDFDWHHAKETGEPTYFGHRGDKRQCQGCAFDKARALVPIKASDL